MSYNDSSVSILETKFAEKKLKFDPDGFEGMIPVQAYGWYDDMRFYFRYRSGIASLTVGFRDLDIVENERAEIIARLDKNIEESVNSLFFESMKTVELSQEYAIDDKAIPNVVKYYAELEFGDSFGGSFGSIKEEVNVFSELMESLKPVDNRK